MRLNRGGHKRGFETIIRLSLKDYFHERLLSVCAVLGLAAVLAPLLLLFGVKSGIINTMADRLIEDPRNREVTPIGSGRYGEDWFSVAAKRPGVAFVIPQTRSIAASMVLYNGEGEKPHSVVVDLIPTGEGDPLLEKWGRVPKNETSVALSNTAARKLNVAAGQEVIGRVGRSVAGIKEQVTIRLKVAAVLPIEAFPREAAFVRLGLLEATEDYRDGRGTEAFGWPGQARPPGPREYPSFRLYARSIYDVATLRDMFFEQGLEVYAKVEEIEVVQSLDRSFTLIFRLIAIVAVFGYFASMASNVLASVNRKSRHLGVTRLIGFSTGSIVWFPIVQSLATSILGTVTAICFYLVVEVLINRLFSQYLSAGEYVCRLSLGHLTVALGFTVAMSIMASAYAAFRVAKIEPSEVIRDV
ncbi:MAG TPA: FtsX-like permease family protein [Acidobacteriota bacterium]|nr:FtsX-like permease family protein [Acidobacteriota bacterium]